MSTEAAAPAATSTNAPGAANAAQESGPGTHSPDEASGLKAPTPTPSEKIKVKVDGKEVEVTLDELKKGYSHGRAAAQRMEQATLQMKQAEEFIRVLKEDPIKVLTDPRLGVNARKVAEEYLLAQLEEDAMDPRDKELRDTKKRLAEKEEAEKRAKEEQEQKRLEAEKAKYREHYQAEIIAALDKSGLPKTEATVKRTAYYLGRAIEKGLDLKAEDVVDMVREDYLNEQKQLVGGLEPEKIMEMFPELADKIRKHAVQSHKKKREAMMPGRAASQPEAPKRRGSQKMSKDEWRAKIRSRLS